MKESVGKFPEFLCEVTVISKVAILNTYLEQVFLLVVTSYLKIYCFIQIDTELCVGHLLS